MSFQEVTETRLPCGTRRYAVVKHRVSFGLIDSLNRWGNCHAGRSEDGAAGALGFAAESEVLYNPKAGDWYWIKYNPDGKTARTPKEKGSKPIAGRFQSCIKCHGGADGDDLLFFND